MSAIGTSGPRRIRHRAAAGAWLVALAMLVIRQATPAEAAAAKLYVANNGTDNSDCGPVDKSPCRSIGRAIAHAAAGDQIIVGPGVYGDIDRDRVLDPSGDSGEEAPVNVGDVDLMTGTVNLAMINVDKPLTIVSRDGAGPTVLDASGQFVNGSIIAVNLAADGVVFGKNRKGFTIRNAALGVHINGVAGVEVGGVVVDTCYQGFLIGSVSGAETAQGTVLKGNVASNSAAAPGFLISDPAALVTGNLATKNVFAGFAVAAGSRTVFTKNLSVGNLGNGFLVGYAGTTSPPFVKNAAIGNTDAGLFVTTPGTAPMEITVAASTFFGNGVSPQYPPTNCGLVVQNSGAHNLTVNADGNYWGAASGPGGEPADAAGGDCSAGAVTLNVTAWATTEIKVKPPTIN